MVTKTDAGLYEVEVDGQKYEFSKWGAEDALDVLLDIAKIVGKPLGAAFGAFAGKDDDGKSKLDQEFNPDMLGTVFEALTDRMDKGVVKGLIKKLAAGNNVFCDGKPVTNFNLHYQDKLPHLFKVVQAALEVQYGNFFVALSGIAKSRHKPITNQAPPP
jgi:hypothetical protein